jgi:hypothetical protein
MAHYETIIGTPYEKEEHVPIAVAEAVWNLFPVLTMGPPSSIDIYGGQGTQSIGVGVTFETDCSGEDIWKCGPEAVRELAVK